ncbi:MAG TPA: hypothetical protein VFO30_07310, partial [Chthoniobacterales bacterium]|nr:hypothetical protein [Chthoniobacterales bacterium]
RGQILKQLVDTERFAAGQFFNHVRHGTSREEISRRKLLWKNFPGSAAHDQGSNPSPQSSP